MYKKPKYELEPGEEEILEAYEKGELVSMPDVKQKKKLAREVAANTLRKDVRINIRLSSLDVAQIKERAAYEGLPYQTLISSVLHKFAAGHL
ncbi:MAG: hypothetical protein JSR46_07500 [Verrucomicrobia bacterium]|nr:hypothetical protein [Verrucomicrobiota bacterium]